MRSVAPLAIDPTKGKPSCWRSPICKSRKWLSNPLDSFP
jgi:hypothetical protein